MDHYYKLAGEAADALYMNELTIDDIVRDRFGPWVTGHFVYDETFINLTLTASDTYLISHRDSNGYFHGVCDEYATLFVSFARFTNIPTRQILIEGYTTPVPNPNKTLSYEFPEVWDGTTWIHIEPSKNYIYNPSTPSIFILMGFQRVGAAKILFDAYDSKSSVDGPDGDGLLSAGEDMIWTNYEGPNSYLFVNYP